MVFFLIDVDERLLYSVEMVHHGESNPEYLHSPNVRQSRPITSATDPINQPYSNNMISDHANIIIMVVGEQQD